VVCFADENFVDLRVKSSSAYPSAPYFNLIGQAGSIITGAQPARVQRAAERCHQSAMAQPAPEHSLTGSRMANADDGVINVSCAASTEAGVGTYVVVSKNK
jgi:hypothetical protein